MLELILRDWLEDYLVEQGCQPSCSGLVGAQGEVEAYVFASLAPIILRHQTNKAHYTLLSLSLAKSNTRERYHILRI